MKAAIFDFDGTLFPVETIPFLIKQYTKLGYSRFKQWSVVLQVVPYLIKYKVFKTMDKEAFRKKAVYIFLQLFEGMTKEETKAYFDKNVPTVIGLLDKRIVDEAKRLKKEGYYTVLLSGCFDMLLLPVADYVGFDEVIGTKLLFEGKSGEGMCVLDAKTPIDVISGDRKAEAALTMANKKAIHLEDSVAYADSYYDRNILELVGHKIGVNPDAGLKEICLNEGWQILETL